MISKNNVIAVCTPLTVVFRSSLMSVIITFMFEPAKLQMNCASASGRISLRADASGRSTVGAWLAGTELSLTRSPAAARVRVPTPKYDPADHASSKSLGVAEPALKRRSCPYLPPRLPSRRR
jgi:hypothetical protein